MAAKESHENDGFILIIVRHERETMGEKITVARISRQEEEELLNRPRFNRFRPVTCGKCGSEGPFERLLYRINGVPENLQDDDAMQNTLRLNLYEYERLEAVHFRTANGFYADAARCCKCATTRVVYDIKLPKDLASELAAEFGKSPENVASDRACVGEVVKHGDMTKTSRNAPCPCGSGKKYKRCCLANDAGVPSSFSADAPFDFPVVYDPMNGAADIDDLSNSVVDLINANRLDEAERACMRLQQEFPECVDGIERLVAVHKAKGNFALAAEYARQTVAFMKEREDDFDPELIWDFEKQEQDLKRRSAEQPPA